jgi:anti-sigma factor RsiW
VTEHAFSHPAEETLEAYALNRLPEEHSAHVEEHLLLCENCRARVEEETEFAALIRAALRQPAATAASRRMFANPWTKVAGIAAAMLGVVLVARNWAGEPPREAAPVALSSFRGSQAVVMAHGPARSPLELGLDASYLAAGEECRVEIVDARGRPAWDGPASLSAGGRLVARVGKPLGAGVYWVRLYRGDAELVQEYGLTLE